MIIRNTISIDSSMDKVWEVLSRPENTGEWQQGFQSWNLISGEKGTNGAKAEWIYKTGSNVVKVIETINQISKGSYEGLFEHDALSLVMKLSTEEEGEGDKTLLKTILDIKFHSSSMAVAAPFMRNVFTTRQENDLRNLKKFIEEKV